jgi:hypothetical protein
VLIRRTEYLVVILTATVLTLGVFYIPETSGAIILTRKARRLRLQTQRWVVPWPPYYLRPCCVHSMAVPCCLLL